VAELRPLTGGASRETWSFTARPRHPGGRVAENALTRSASPTPAGSP